MYHKRANSSYYIFIIYIIISMFCPALSLAEEKADDPIFKYKKELSITDAQEKNLRDILSRIQNYFSEKTAELDRHRAELNKMIANKADLNMIKVKLQTIARIQADATYEDIASVRAIEEELSAAQMSKWRVIQEEFRKKSQQAQAVMSEKKGAAK